MTTYRGWRIGNDERMFYAFQWGVRLCANSLESLKKVIDFHIKDLEKWRNRP